MINNQSSLYQELPFWTPIVYPQTTSKWANLFIQLGIYADRYVYLGDQEISLKAHQQRLPPHAVRYIAETKKNEDLTIMILKVSTFILSCFILPVVALPIKGFYKAYIHRLEIHQLRDNRAPVTTQTLPIGPSQVQENISLTEKTIGNSTIALVTGDLTNESSDLIVNAANAYLLAGNGVCGAIYKAAGASVFDECSRLLKTLDKDRLSCGEVALTASGQLAPRIRGIVHAVGPDCRIHTENQERKELLKRTYMNALEAAIKKYPNACTVSFPSISTGIYEYPAEEASDIALNVVKDFILQHPNISLNVRFVFLTNNDTLLHYKTALNHLN